MHMKKSGKPYSKKNEVSNIEDPLAGDLTDFIRDGDWTVAQFELSEKKDKVISLRLSEKLFKELKKQAAALGINTQKFIRISLENLIRKRVS